MQGLPYRISSDSVPSFQIPSFTGVQSKAKYNLFIKCVNLLKDDDRKKINNMEELLIALYYIGKTKSYNLVLNKRGWVNILVLINQ